MQPWILNPCSNSTQSTSLIHLFIGLIRKPLHP